MSAIEKLIKDRRELEAMADVYMVNGLLSDEAAAELSALRARVAELEKNNNLYLSLLRKSEWSSSDGADNYCLFCDNYNYRGHKEDCELSAVLKGNA